MKDIYTALITPFDSKGEIDYFCLRKLIDHLIQLGNTNFVILGTTGETPTLSLSEKKQMLRFIRHHFPQIKTIVGISTNSTSDAIYQIKQFNYIGKFEAYMVVVPYYNKPNQKGLFSHFDMIASSIDEDIIIYNIPSRCGVAIEYDTIISLSNKHKNIVGIKEAGSIEKISMLKEALPNFKIYLGNDGDIQEGYIKGADGIVSVASHIIYPTIAHYLETLNLESLKKIEIISEYLFMEPNPTPVKYILSKQGLVKNYVRLPLVTVDIQCANSLDIMEEKYM